MNYFSKLRMNTTVQQFSTHNRDVRLIRSPTIFRCTCITIVVIKVILQYRILEMIINHTSTPHIMMYTFFVLLTMLSQSFEKRFFLYCIMLS